MLAVWVVGLVFVQQKLLIFKPLIMTYIKYTDLKCKGQLNFIKDPHSTMSLPMGTVIFKQLYWSIIDMQYMAPIQNVHFDVLTRVQSQKWQSRWFSYLSPPKVFLCNLSISSLPASIFPTSKTTTLTESTIVTGIKPKTLC